MSAFVAESVEDAFIRIASLTAGERVANGVRWLDENFSGWADRINPDTLDLHSSEECICGQLWTQTAIDAQERGELFLDRQDANGFEYAQKTLFTEANSWISGMVCIDVTPAEWAAGYELTREEQDRVKMVSAALGFNQVFEVWTTPMTKAMNDAWVADKVSCHELGQAWLKVLANRGNGVYTD